MARVSALRDRECRVLPVVGTFTSLYISRQTHVSHAKGQISVPTFMFRWQSRCSAVKLRFPHPMDENCCCVSPLKPPTGKRSVCAVRACRKQVNQIHAATSMQK